MQVNTPNEKEASVAILEEAAQLVADRLCQYDAVLADMYFMAGHAGDQEIQREIW